jgi:hypothetical protein
VEARRSSLRIGRSPYGSSFEVCGNIGELAEIGGEDRISHLLDHRTPAVVAIREMLPDRRYGLDHGRGFDEDGEVLLREV